MKKIIFFGFFQKIMEKVEKVKNDENASDIEEKGPN